MAKRKKKDRSAQSAHRLRLNGLQAFRDGNYDEALDAWERASDLVPKHQPKAAMAEAYFRRSLKRQYGENGDTAAGLADLKQALTLQPDDALYQYHLALAHHRAGDLDTAVSLYQTVYQNSQKLRPRLAYPLCLALRQQVENPITHPAWHDLSAKAQEMLGEANAFRRRPYAPSPDAPPLWHGLARLDSNDVDAAHKWLTTALEEANNAYEQAISHYYLGVLAARQEDWPAAARSWVAARQAGLNHARLSDNMGELFHRLAEERLQEGNVTAALNAAKEAARHAPDDSRLHSLQAQIQQHVGYQAAQKSQWTTARRHWEEAQELDGGSFRLAYNLALVYEQEKEFEEAGDTWREAMRRRPRRDDHPDAISEQQVAQLWRRAAAAYEKAGEFDAAVQVYRNAVKYSPDNVEIRLDLVHTLHVNGQEEAALNELDRILERDPQNVQALLRYGEILAHSYGWWRGREAPGYWEEVLEIDPNNSEARQLLADYYQDRAEASMSWRATEEAIDYLEMAHKYQPENGRILAKIARFYLYLDDEEIFRDYSQQALQTSPHDIDVYDELIQAWLSEDEPDEAWALLDQAEATIPKIPSDFYLEFAAYCLSQLNNYEWGRIWLDRALARAPADDSPLLEICELTIFYRVFDLAKHYLAEAQDQGEDKATVTFLWAMFHFHQRNLQEAGLQIRRAERLARQQRDEELLDRISHLRYLINSPVADMMGPLMNRYTGHGMPDPSFIARMLAEMMDDDDFDDFDEDDFFYD
jgi:tetratricopeptide (TPR) repeat protein